MHPPLSLPPLLQMAAPTWVEVASLAVCVEHQLRQPLDDEIVLDTVLPAGTFHNLCQQLHHTGAGRAPAPVSRWGPCPLEYCPSMARHVAAILLQQTMIVVLCTGSPFACPSCTDNPPLAPSLGSGLSRPRPCG